MYVMRKLMLNSDGGCQIRNFMIFLLIIFVIEFELVNSFFDRISLQTRSSNENMIKVTIKLLCKANTTPVTRIR